MALSLQDATKQGVTRHTLRGKRWLRIGSKVYRRTDKLVDNLEVLTAWQETMPAASVFCGTTAAWLLGLDFDPTGPVDVIVPPTSGTRSREGVRARRRIVGLPETVVVRGLRTTNLKRTLLDLCLEQPAVEALVAIDMALRRRKISRTDLDAYALQVAGRPGSATFRQLVALGEPVDSPMETRVRWLLMDDGLARPEVQKNLYDNEGKLVGRADLYYASARLVIEFDGRNHKERLVSDDRRQNLIINAGYTILRFTTADLRDRPEVILAQVRAALGARKRRG